MKNKSEKYDRLLSVLKSIKADPVTISEIEQSVFERISAKRQAGKAFSAFMEFMFGWIYIGWVRRSLIAVSIILIGFFLWQQNNMMNQINDLSNSIKERDRMIIYNPGTSLEKRQMLLKYSLEKSGGYYISEEDLATILDSLDHLNIRYRNLIDLIDEDTLLKKRIEGKLEMKLRSKIKL